jgi:hypothetical protein
MLTGDSKEIASGPEHSTLDACTADDVKFGVTDPPDCCDFLLKAGNTQLDLR